MTPPPPLPRTPKPEWAVAFKKRREDKVGSQEELAIQADVSQSLISQIERGVQHPTGVSVERFARLLSVLKWTVEEFSEATGIEFSNLPLSSRSAAFAASAQYGNIPLEEDEIDEALLEAAREYGDKAGFEGLADPVTQRALQSIDFRQRPATPEEWLSKFLKFRDELRSSHDA